ncbi:unnamed protein product [Brassica oleracea]
MVVTVMVITAEAEQTNGWKQCFRHCSKPCNSEDGVPHLRGSFPWFRLGSGPLHPGGLYLGWGQGPTPSTVFDDKMDSSPLPGVEPGSMTIGPQSPYQTSYLIPSTSVELGGMKYDKISFRRSFVIINYAILTLFLKIK